MTTTDQDVFEEFETEPTMVSAEFAGPTKAMLLVHGIGHQGAGSTLASGTDAIVTWLQTRLGDSELVDWPDQSRQIALRSATLTEAALEGGSPAHALLDLHRMDRESKAVDTETWLLSESWWAETFNRPSYYRMLRWTLRSAIATVGSEAAELYDRFLHAWRSRRMVATAIAAISLYLYWMALAAALVAVGLLSIGAFVPWVRRRAIALQAALTGSVGDSYALVRSPTSRAAIVAKVRDDIRALHTRGLSDLVIVAHSQGAEVARLALMEATRGGALEPARIRLITYGSAIRKLRLLDRIRAGHGPRMPLTLIVAVSLAISASGILGTFALVELVRNWDPISSLPSNHWVERLVMVAGIVVIAVIPLILNYRRQESVAMESGLAYTPPPEASDASRWRTAAFAIFLFTALMIATVGSAYQISVFWHSASWKNVPQLSIPVLTIGLILANFVAWRTALAIDEHDTSFVDHPRVEDFSWVDILSSADPVASAGMRIAEEDKLRTVVIHNLRSVFLDHSQYWHNWAEFIPRVLREIHGVSNWDGKSILTMPDSWIVHQYGLRARRTATLAIIRLEGFVACAALLLEPPAYITQASLHLVELLQNLPVFWVQRWNPETGKTIVSLALIALLGLAFYGLTLTGWRSSQRRARSRALDLLRMTDDAIRVREASDPHNRFAHADVKLVTRCRVQNRESLLLLTERDLVLFPIVPRGSLGPQQVIGLETITNAVTVRFGVVRVATLTQHIHIRPRDGLAKRSLRDRIESVRRPREQWARPFAPLGY